MTPQPDSRATPRAVRLRLLAALIAIVAGTAAVIIAILLVRSTL
jgi:hypothetical protein